MQPTGGKIVEGKVVGITKFGAFVSLPDGRSGLVHISEIANTYVNDVNDHLSMGQAVRVVILSEAEGGKINLSIKRAQEPSPGRPAPAQERRPVRPAPPRQEMYTSASTSTSFEDKLKQFMHDSDSKNSGNRLYSDRKNTSRKRRDK